MKRLIEIAVLALAFLPLAHAGEWSGYIAEEALLFAEDSLSNDQHNSYLSLAFEPEYYHEWKNGKRSFTFTPFARYDQHDYERTHFDVRELNFVSVQKSWEVRAGISKVFWGVLESVHLVDVINQTDQVENLDGEDKLGQPMIMLSTAQNWGTVDLFVLPGFRERTFPSKEGRPRLSIPIDNDNSIYESGDKEKHVDYALRWSHYLGDWDFGLAHFHGTSREPVFVPQFNALGVPVKLVPRYDQIDQTSIDIQATLGSWLWKFESIYRSGQNDSFFAAGGGIEYTFVGLRETSLDLGIVMEYLYDERGDIATSPFQKDLFAGARLTFNDAQSTEFLGGITVDLEGGPQSYNIEASRRIGDSYKLSTEIRGVLNTEQNEVQHFFRDDHSIRLELARYF